MTRAGADLTTGSTTMRRIEPGRRIMPEPPDVVLLAGDWQPRALIRAQLIEEGFEVVATNTWPMMRRHLRTGSKPRLAILDLKSLPDPEQRLHDVRVLM